ncbi:MAG: VCBS repeat-containing protein [Rhodothermaceae bacterium]|nr:VCBS repeat-containing protein [Rhodothermaceae bacterium]
MPSRILFLLLAGILIICPQALSAQSFVDASDLLPEINFEVPLGASMIDVNSDGRVDIYRRRQLFIQQPDGTFKDDFQQLGLNGGSGVVFGAIFGDYDEDGFVDAFFMDLVNPSTVFRNHAGMQFTQVDNEIGIRDQDLVQGSLWTDYNQDGLIDLFVGIDGGISSLFTNTSDYLFFNVGDQAGLEYQATYGLAAADYDRDGDIDIFLTQCLPPMGSSIAENVLLNLEDGVYTNVSPDVGIIDNLASWGTVWLDYNNDGWLDIFTANISMPNGSVGTNTLYRNNEGVSFTDVSTEANIAGQPDDETFSVSAADFDNDGWTDLFVVNRSGDPYLFRNKGDGTFEDIVPLLPNKPINSSALSVGDVNNDGWIDVFIPTIGNDQLLINEGGTNHFIKVYTTGIESNRFGIGTRIDLYAGGMHQVREIQAGDGMTSQNHNLSAHFGLGQNTLVDSLVVHWPSGATDRFTSVDSDQEITIVEQVGINTPPSTFSLKAPTDTTTIDGDQLFKLSWESAIDPEQDELSYALHITGSSLDTTFTSITENELLVSRDVFTNGEFYNWAVTVTDGYSIRGTLPGSFEFSQSVHVERPDDNIPIQTSPLLAFPNPFEHSSTITYEVLHTEQVRIEVYNTLGQRTADLVNHIHSPGQYSLEWSGLNAEGKKVAPGVYIIRMVAESGQSTQLVIRK